MSAKRRLQDGTWRVPDALMRAAAGTAAVAICLHAASADVHRVVRAARPVVDSAGQDDVDVPAYLARTRVAGERTAVLDAARVPCVDGVGLDGDTPQPESRVDATSAARRQIAMICLVMVMTQIYLGGALDTWAGAGSFGQRRLVGLTVFFVMGLTTLLVAVRHLGEIRSHGVCRSGGLVEPRSDGAVRSGVDGSSAPRSPLATRTIIS